MKSGAAHVGVKRQTQQCLKFESYLSQRTADAWSDAGTALSVKIHDVAKFCYNINLVLPTEKTRVRVTATLLALSNMVDVSPAHMHSIYESVSQTIKAYADKRPAPVHHLAKHLDVL